MGVSLPLLTFIYNLLLYRDYIFGALCRFMLLDEYMLVNILSDDPGYAIKTRSKSCLQYFEPQHYTISCDQSDIHITIIH